MPLGTRKIPQFGSRVHAQEESFGCEGGGGVSLLEGKDEFADVYVLAVGQPPPGVARRLRAPGKLFEHQVAGFRQFGSQEFDVPRVLGVQ